MADYTCNVCGKEGDWESAYSYHDIIQDKYFYRCEPCAILEWDCPIQIVFHAGIPLEVRTRLKSGKVLKRLVQWFRKDTTFVVDVFHRQEIETVAWQHKYDLWVKKPIPEYGYRGFCSHDRIVLVYDETETPDSMEWILYHELGHHECQKFALMIDDAMAAENKNRGQTDYNWKDDAAHEADAEEMLVNRVATAFMGGKEYARPWWRARVKAKLAGEPMPDLNSTEKIDTSKLVKKPRTKKVLDKAEVS